MNYTYQASGVLVIKKCGITWDWQPIFVYPARFAVGEPAWLRFRAVKGIMEYVIIGKIKLVTHTYQGRGGGTLIYFDTLRAAYNENELITNSEAADLAMAYLVRQANKLQSLC